MAGDLTPCENCPNPIGCTKAGRCGGGGHPPGGVMQPEVKEWLEHLEELILAIAAIVGENTSHALDDAVKAYGEKMEGL